jgi:hypothetical protein
LLSNVNSTRDARPDIIATGRQTGRADLLERGAEVIARFDFRLMIEPGCGMIDRNA